MPEEATPPDDTVSTPPLPIVMLLVTVPATLKLPPVDTVTSWTTPPESTFSVPFDDTETKAALPRLCTSNSPPATDVPEPVTPVATPPFEIVSTPPLKTVTLLVVVPATLKLPPDTTMSCTTPPADSFRMPKDIPAKPSLPPANHVHRAAQDRRVGSTGAVDHATGRDIDSATRIGP